MSRTSSKGNRFWIDDERRVMEMIDGVSHPVDQLTHSEVARLKASGWTIGSSTRRYRGNPARYLRP